ncbi:MAG: exosortase A, partial [Thiohalomonadales bacterium]
VPFGEFLIPILQDFTAVFTVKSLRLVGIPVFWEGLYFHLPTGSYEVAEACSGIRYLIASVALGTLFAYLNFVSLGRRIIFISLSLVVPIIANGLRAFGIVLVANITDQQFGKGVDHLIYGWLFFGLVMFLLFWLGHKMRENNGTSELVVGNNKTTVFWPQLEDYPVAIIVISSALLLGGPGLLSLSENFSNKNAMRQISLPFGVNGWTGPNETYISWSLIYSGATTQKLKQYYKNEKKVYLHLADYNTQSEPTEIIGAENKLIDAESWRRVSATTRRIELSEGDEFQVNEVTIKSKNRNMILWQWFIVNEASTNNSILAKIYEVSGIISGQNYGVATIMISAIYVDDPNEARLKLTTFIHDMGVAVTYQANHGQLG